MGKPTEKDSYTGFDQHHADASKRTAEKLDPVKDDADPEKAVPTLVRYLQDRRTAYRVSAEEQLYWWGSKQGVDKIVVRHVRPLLKHPLVELRAPALRLTVRFGDHDADGDLIECLADEEYGIRETAFKALKARTRTDFNFDPGGGEVARAHSVNQWRQWWQAEQRQVAVQPPSVYERNPVSGPKVVSPNDKNQDKDKPANDDAKSSDDTSAANNKSGSSGSSARSSGRVR